MLQNKKLLKSTISIILVLLLTITCMPISASATTSETTLDVVSIEVEPISITEYTNGNYYYDFRSETDDWESKYYYYWPEDIMEYTITLNDGTTITDVSSSFYYNDEWYDFDYETNQSYENQWTAGNTYTMTVSFGGITVDVPVTITESPFESIEIAPISIMEYSHGDYSYNYNPDTNQYDLVYYYYLPEYLFEYTITLKDGTIINDSSYYFYYNDEYYYFDYETNQSYENQWTAGNTYTMDVSLLNLSVDIPVTITESPFKSVDIKPISIIEASNGSYSYDYNPETEDWDLEYFHYYPEDLMEYTITLNDDTTITGTGYEFYYDDEYYYFDYETNQGADNQWTAGNTYTMTVSFGGITVDVPVTITESPFVSIEVEPVTLYEKLDGYYTNEYNPETDDYDLEYFYYSMSEKTKNTITLKDGSTINFTGDSFYYNDEVFYLNYNTNQSYDNQWTVGNTYNIDAYIYGKEHICTEGAVTIVENPIKSIDFEPISIIENTTGGYVFGYNPETEEWDLEYFEYSPLDKLNYTVTLTDGTTISGKGNGFKYEDVVYTFDDWSTNQSYDNQWTVGNTYTATAKFCDLTVDIPVTIIENPFKSIEVKPITIKEFTNGTYLTDYNPETGECDLEYYYYYLRDFLEYTITLNDGTKINSTGYAFEYDGETYYLITKYDQSYENQWTAGNTYTVNVNLSTTSVDVPVTITSSTPTPTLKGDVDGDGLITIKDATMVQEHVARYKNLTDTSALNADVDGSGDINIVDATYIQMYVAKQITSFDKI